MIMQRFANRWTLLSFILTGGALVPIGIAIFTLKGHSATADVSAWPPLTMTYIVEVSVNDLSVRQVRRLTYESTSSWIEEVVEADDVVLEIGSFNATGSYQKVDGDQYTSFDISRGEKQTETIPEDVLRIPRAGFDPVPIGVIERALDKSLTKVQTKTRVCFNDECTDNAPGWKLEEDRSVAVFADDARGIPVRIASFVVAELRVHDERVPLR